LPPWPVWGAAGAASLLHALPFLRTRLGEAAPGHVWIGVPYQAKDWLAYLAFIREQPRVGEALLANPFTTEPQAGRFVLLMHHALAFVHRITGADPGWLLELTRTAAILALAAALWSFLDGFWTSSRTRAWAVVLVLLSGGFGFLATFVAEALPSELRATVLDELRPAYGWTTYEALYNPLWVIGLALLLVALRLIIQPGGPRSRRDIAVAAATLLVLWFTHVYTAIALLAILGTSLAGEWITAGSLLPRRALRIAAAVVPPLLVAAAVAHWQRGDGVFLRVSDHFFGQQSVGIFFFPIVFAAVGVFALRGWADWSASGHPWRHAMGGWIAAAALLISSPLLNGYHFVPYAYLPAAILAAEPVAKAFAALRLRPEGALGGTVALGLLLFASTPVVAASAVAKVEDYQMPADLASALGALSRASAGNVLSHAEMGNLVPAFGPHRVWVGQWFLTPDFKERSDRATRALSGEDPEELRRIVVGERIDEVLVPSALGPAVAAALPDLSPRIERYGAIALVRLRGR
jgi:hypothetical protein